MALFDADVFFYPFLSLFPVLTNLSRSESAPVGNYSDFKDVVDSIAGGKDSAAAVRVEMVYFRANAAPPHDDSY